MDGSDASLSDASLVACGSLRVLRRARNGGKGAAVLDALRLATAAGFTRALVMDADGQHPAPQIRRFMAASRARPEAMVPGVPQFGPNAPALRVGGRRLSNWCAQLGTGWAGIGDSLFGFRVHPVGRLLPIMERSSRMRGFFDPEAAAQLSWDSVPTVNLQAPGALSLGPTRAGASHFRSGRGNLLLAAMHARLVAGAAARLPSWRGAAATLRTQLR